MSKPLKKIPSKRTSSLTLYGVVHLHEYGHTLYLVWADHEPTQEEIEEHVLTSPFEEEKGESLLVDTANLWQASVLRSG